MLDAVAEAVGPFALPDELRRFWERVDPGRLEITLFPELLGPRSSLDLHRVAQGFPVPNGPPPLLFVFGYSSHVHRSIELASKWSDGGTIINWAWDEPGFRIAYRSFVDLVEVVSELVSEGRLEHRGGFVVVSLEHEEAKQLARLRDQEPHPLYGDAREISGDVELWPAHWLAASGIDLRDREPRGATHTIAELVEAAEAGLVRGRITGRIIRSAGIGGDAIVLVDDGTGTLDVWCPEGLSPWSAQSDRYEFEITIEGPVQAPLDFDTGHAELQSHALAGRIEEAQAAAEAFLGRISRHRPQAVASAMRPLD
jgi:hypothetical protein